MYREYDVHYMQYGFQANLTVSGFHLPSYLVLYFNAARSIEPRRDRGEPAGREMLINLSLTNILTANLNYYYYYKLIVSIYSTSQNYYNLKVTLMPF